MTSLIMTEVFKEDRGGNLLFVDKTDSGGVYFSLVNPKGEILYKDSLEFDYDIFCMCILKLGYHRYGNHNEAEAQVST